MENPRPEKVAVVDEVKSRLTDADAAVLTDYRGIDVPGMATLRSSLREAGAEYQIYKNSLVRFAARDLGLEIEEMLVGPTAIAFVRRDGDGDPVLMAKALREFAKVNPNLEVKGGLLGDRPLTAADVDKLAQVAPREELLASLAYGLAAPMVQFAGLLQALPRNFAYGLKALIDQQGGMPATPAPEPEAAAAEAPAAEAEAEDAPAAEAAYEALSTGLAEAGKPLPPRIVAALGDLYRARQAWEPLATLLARAARGAKEPGAAADAWTELGQLREAHLGAPE
ncbi:MAG TPA: 50S ribosomal protein L10, partial [Acidimicrobiales bacterium]